MTRVSQQVIVDGSYSLTPVKSNTKRPTQSFHIEIKRMSISTLDLTTVRLMSSYIWVLFTLLHIAFTADALKVMEPTALLRRITLSRISYVTERMWHVCRKPETKMSLVLSKCALCSFALSTRARAAPRCVVRRLGCLVLLPPSLVLSFRARF